MPPSPPLPPHVTSLWGKAQPRAGSSVVAYHPLAYHCLDVAAVAKVFLERDRLVLPGLSRSLGLDQGATMGFLTWLIALHDIGKVCDGFQGLVPELMEHLQGRRGRESAQGRHDAYGLHLFNGPLLEALLKSGRLVSSTRLEGDDDPYDWAEALAPLFAAVTGHHGQPPGPLSTKARAFDLKPANLDLATKLALDLAGLLLPDTPPIQIDRASFSAIATQCSWLVAGVTILADWLGSDQSFFPYQAPNLALASYWRDLAQPRAIQAIEAAGVLPPKPAEAPGFSTLFPHITTPTPLQQAVLGLPLEDGPQIFILEDQTGSGKTEAALLLAHRLMKAGSAEGIFMGLPTQATANSMYQRLLGCHRRLFQPSESLSLRLVHGASKLGVLTVSSPSAAQAPAEMGYQAEEETATQLCTQWLADHNKRALLAPVGAGTIDQALLSVLPSRHNALRLLGVSRSVLIIDEVHGADAYLGRLLEALLRFHAALGGSAILLSATLHAGMRDTYLKAFDPNLEPGPEGSALERPFPQISALGPSGLRALAVAPRAGAAREIPLALSSSEAEVEDALVEIAESGGCACWIRNTVADAMESFEALRARLPGRVSLFHARFTLGDRLRHEAEVSRSFGKESQPEDRRGKILVATQVVEQSLDLDFDGMATDLAPIDLIMQRGGRLRRHRRDHNGAPLSGDASKDGRPERPLLVLSPDPAVAPDEDWFSRFAPRGRWVYPEHGRLWLTAKMIKERGVLRLPEDARALIEGVYGDEASDQVPPALREVDRQAAERERRNASTANFRALDFEAGYIEGATPWRQDTGTPTRLGQATVTLRLAIEVDGKLKPYFEDEHHPWALSDVRVPARWLRKDNTLEDPRITAAKATMPDRGKWCRVVIIPPESINISTLREAGLARSLLNS